MRKAVKELIDWAERIGFINEGLDGNGHYKLRHSNGFTYSVGATPSDHRAQLNAKSDLRRLAAQ